jgi:hypothetical protein
MVSLVWEMTNVMGILLKFAVKGRWNEYGHTSILLAPNVAAIFRLVELHSQFRQRARRSARIHLSEQLFGSAADIFRRRPE